MIRTILGLCARDNGHPSMYGLLQQALAEYSRSGAGWDKLVLEAERQGIAPLFYRHIIALGFVLPADTRRVLQTLHLRSKRSNALRNLAIVEILPAFLAEDIDVLLVKGIALANFAYTSPAYRPMRDIDLLVKKTDLVKAEIVLLDLGYRSCKSPDIPIDYHHLDPLVKTLEGLEVSIELHHNLLPLHAHYPLWPYEKSSPSAITVHIDQSRAQTLSLEESLDYVYLHGFRAPLTYEEFRFIHVADIVNLVERYIDTINWQQIHAESPALFALFNCIHHLTPWSEPVAEQLALDIDDKPSKPGVPYRGWPRRSLKTVRGLEIIRFSTDTLWPSKWWVQMYYGSLGWPCYLKARFFEHPRMLWRWLKAHWNLFCRNILK